MPWPRSSRRRPSGSDAVTSPRTRYEVHAPASSAPTTKSARRRERVHRVDPGRLCAKTHGQRKARVRMSQGRDREQVLRPPGSPDIRAPLRTTATTGPKPTLPLRCSAAGTCVAPGPASTRPGTQGIHRLAHGESYPPRSEPSQRRRCASVTIVSTGQLAYAATALPAGTRSHTDQAALYAFARASLLRTIAVVATLAQSQPPWWPSHSRWCSYKPVTLSSLFVSATG